MIRIKNGYNRFIVLVAGVGFIPPRCCGMGQRGEQPKETPFALPSDFFFCSQDDVSIN